MIDSTLSRVLGLLIFLSLLLFLFGCSGGGGGGGSQDSGNPPPTADAGSNQTVTSDTMVTLDGTGSSDDAGIESYAWSRVSGSGGGLSNEDQAEATFVPASQENSTEDYVFELTVSDEQNETDSDNTGVSVYPGEFEANMTFSATDSTHFEVGLQLAEEDAPPVNATVAWGDGSSSSSNNLSAGDYTFGHEYADTLTYEVECTVDNRLGQTDSRTWYASQPEAVLSVQSKPNPREDAVYSDTLRVGNLTEQENPPFNIQVDWNDGDTNSSSNLSAGDYTFQHTYANQTKAQKVNATVENDLGQTVADDILISRLPDTGQTAYYNNSTEIGRPSEGEDFYGQDAQYSINPPSYTKLNATGHELDDSATVADGLAMVRDEVSGLVWEVKTDDDSIHDRDFQHSWHNATNATGFVAELNENNFGGYSDWRIPTIKELTSIVNYGNDSPAINSTYFPNTQPSFSNYWSSTTRSCRENYAWRVSSGTGSVAFSVKSNILYVRAVRSGRSSSSYTDNGDGTVTDNETGLMWMKTTMNTDGDGDIDTDDQVSWQKALAYCDNSTLAGYEDWRLPNIKELHSIVDYSTCDPIIDRDYFQAMSSRYWSSTTYSRSEGYAWCVDFDQGEVEDRSKSDEWYVRPVRGGQ